MITVKVTYGVKKEFVPTNLKNIALFLSDFQKMDPEAFRYNVYFDEAKQVFVHLSHFRDEKIQHEILNVPSFKEFQRQRDESGLAIPHQLEVLQPVGFSKALFS